MSGVLVDEAKALGLSVSQACENGLREEVRKAREQAWLAQNQAAIEASNDFVERHGLPLARFRQF